MKLSPMMNRSEIIKEARAFFDNKWPKQLWTGVMFFKGLRITKDEFEVEQED